MAYVGNLSFLISMFCKMDQELPQLTAKKEVAITYILKQEETLAVGGDLSGGVWVIEGGGGINIGTWLKRGIMHGKYKP